VNREQFLRIVRTKRSTLARALRTGSLEHVQPGAAALAEEIGLKLALSPSEIEAGRALEARFKSKASAQQIAKIQQSWVPKAEAAKG
jgi:hypothetical protein